MEFNNYDEILKYVNESGKEILNDVAYSIKEDIVKYIDENLYNAYDPRYYDRTYSFRECIEVEVLPKSKSRIYGFKIIFNTDKLAVVSASKPGYWNSHMSKSKERVAKYVPKWLDEGVNTPYFQREGIDLTGYIRKLFNDDDTFVRKLSKKYGEHSGTTSFNVGFKFNLDRMFG